MADAHESLEASVLSEARRPKAIVLFSDGTGNSSAALFKTNAWRMYESIDLGPAAAGMRPQIAYYDDGVGTSSFKPLAVLGGAFGWGLKRNVLDIYRYLCRNYREGDEIYIFGFSRGAFTARRVAALIASQGLVRSEDETELRHRTLLAYRLFREPLLPLRLEWPTRVVRAVRDRVVGVWCRILRRAPYDPDANARPTIRFLGVWDTVGAYGGPIIEVTRAIDNWFFRISMRDYGLDPKVECARHALAMDDERDAFHPLLWDEVHEEELIAKGLVTPDRLRQVWFSGMHSDVGGGYPDESLSYVPLLWMMEEAENAGLRTVTYIKDRIVALASSYGPVHDSRSGLGAYYRYQPRKIASWLDPVDPRFLSVQDPVMAPHGKARGLLRTVRVHESVINRIVSGTDRYAPITLPDTFEVVPPESVGETSPQATSASGSPEGHGPRTLVGLPLRARLQDTSRSALRRAAQEHVWDYVWWRRVVYFVTLLVTLALVALPLVFDTPAPDLPRTDSHTVVGSVIRLLTLVLPSIAAPWIEVYAAHPYVFLAMAAAIWMLLQTGTWLENVLRDCARAMWRDEFMGRLEPKEPSRLQRFRNSAGYQRTLRALKWRVLPDFLITPLILIAVGYFLLGGYTQVWLSFAERSRLFCNPANGSSSPIAKVNTPFSPRDLCSASLGTVTRGARYQVTFEVPESDPWFDSDLPATPRGLPSSAFPWGSGYLAVPLRRAIRAQYLQPLIEIRTPRNGPGSWEDVAVYSLDLQPVAGSRTVWRAEFTAPRDGRLFVFVNDAVLPWTWTDFDYRYFYERSGLSGKKGNSGAAVVAVEVVG